MRRALAVVLCLGAGAAAAEPHTWAFAVGNNRGVSGEETLRYATSDATRFLETLREVSGLTVERQELVTAADATEVRAALARFSARLARGAQSEDRLLVYVSSHADGDALHLSGTALPVAELLGLMKSAKVAVGVLVLDACRSGAATRLKGLKPSAGAKVQLEAAQVEGRVVLSSSSDDEYAQESEALGGGVFTHHLLAGLRGAADSSKDGRVTLEEAYLYAHARTLESTLGSKGGAQRPEWRVDLVGQGELVLAEPARASGQLKLLVKAPGRWLVVADSSNAVVAEVEKAEGEAALAVAPGRYRVSVRTERGWLERRVDVPASGGAAVRGEDLEQASLVQLARKGAGPLVVAVSAGGGVSSGLVKGLGAVWGGGARLRREGALLGPLNLITFGLDVREAQATGLVPFHQAEVEPRLGLGHVFLWDRFHLALALELGVVLVLQSELPDASRRFGAEPTAVVSVEASLRLVGPVAAYLHGAFGGALVRRDAGLVAVPRGLGSLGLRLDL